MCRTLNTAAKTLFFAVIPVLAATSPALAQPAQTPPAQPPSAQAPPASPQATEPPAQAPEPAATKAKPWRLAEAVGSPMWLRFGALHRTRYEHLFNQFRAGSEGSGGVLSFRTSITGELRFDPLRIGVELIDSRGYLGNDSIPLNTTLINPVELLEAHIGVVLTDIVTPKDKLAIRAGRITMNVGSRRLQARNRFRNTINGFTGVDALYNGDNGLQLRAFAALPLQRLPSSAEDLDAHKIEFDKESFDVLYGGLFASSPKLLADIQIEGYLFGLHESDGEGRRTKNRRLLTPGFRAYRKAARGEFDFEFESAFQVGKSRAGRSADDERDLDHLAMFQHMAVGYTFALPASPRLLLQYDFASGDDDPTDDRAGRFETLFGARRFEFGPTGIYGAFARANIQTPGARVLLKPHKMLSGFVAYRAYWLDETSDGWTTSGVKADNSDSSSFVGHQLEARARFTPWAGNLRIEPGIAHLFPGAFLDEASNANPNTDTTTVYLQVSGQL